MANKLNIALQRAKLLNKLWPQGKQFHKQALAFTDFYQDKIIVIKYGGFALSNQKIVKSFAKNISLFNQLGLKVVIVHGGGPQIEKEMQKQKIKDQEYQGLRVTNKKILSIVKKIIGRELNPMIVKNISQSGGKAKSINGITKKIIQAKKILNGKIGFVGTPSNLNKTYILELLKKGTVPVISPLGYDKLGNTYNINADLVAGKLAEVLQAEKLMLLTNVSGLLDAEGKTLTGLSTEQVQELITSGVIHSGMLPKIQCALSAVHNGVTSAHIIDGRVSHAALLEIFSDEGIGTLISNQK